ncbi:MAG: glycosyltransferase family 4 protein [Candidatus Omnitrophota bacterium]
MKICIAALFGMHRTTGGIQAHLKWLMRYFEENGIDYIYASPYNYNRALVYPVFAVRCLLKKFSRHLSTYWFRKWHYYFLKKALARLFARRHFDVVNAQGPLAALAALEVRQRYGYHYQVVLTVHMNWPSQAEEDAFAGNIKRNGRYYRRIKEMEGRVFLKVDKIVFVSNYIKEAMFNDFPDLLGKPHAVIYNGVAVDAGGKGAAGAGSKPYFASVGHLELRKNQGFLLQVMKKIVVNFPDSELRLVGGGEDRAKLEKMACAFGLNKNVVFTGFLRNVYPCLAGAYLYLHASLGESCPFAIIEAMSLGIPVISFSTGGIPEIVEHGFNGLLVKDKNIDTYAGYIERLILHKAERDIMSGNCLKLCRDRFNYKIMGRGFIEFYRRGGLLGAGYKAS